MYEISLIIPVYNAEKFVSSTLDTIINQTIFEKIKVILINDGSTDRSLEICDKYAKKFENIEVISQENQGVSAARNKGLEHVRTPYVTFFDSDDITNCKMYEVLLNNIKKFDADFATVNYSDYYIEEDKEIVKKAAEFKIVENRLEMNQLIFSSNRIDNSVCDKLFKLETICNIRFEKDYKIGEDMYFVFKAIQNAKRIVIDTNYVGFKYIQHKSSAMNNQNFHEKFIDPVILSQKMYDECPLENKKHAKAHIIHEKCKAIYIMLVKNGLNHPKYKEYLNDVRKYSLIEAKKNLTLKLFLSVILMKIHPKLYQMFKR